MPAGAYSSIFVYRTIANDIGYVVYYDENTEDQVDNMPDPNPEEAKDAKPSKAKSKTKSKSRRKK